MNSQCFHPAGVGAWWMQVCHSEKDKVIACTQLDDIHLSDVKWTANCHIRYKRLNLLKRDQIKDVFFLPTKSNTQSLLSKVQWLLKWGMIGWLMQDPLFIPNVPPGCSATLFPRLDLCSPNADGHLCLQRATGRVQLRWPHAGERQEVPYLPVKWGWVGLKKKPQKQLLSLSKQIWNHGPEFCMELCQQPWKACEKARLGGPEATCSPVAPRPAVRRGRGVGPGWAGAWPGLLLPLAWLGLSLRHLL